MMRFCVIGLLAAALALPAMAGDAERKKLAEELLKLMKFDRNMEQSFAAARQMQMAQARSLTLSTFDAEAARDVRERTMDLLQEELSWKKLKDEFVEGYAEVFSEDELKGLVDFYRTPVGRAYVEKVPRMMQRSAEITQRRMTEIGPKVQAIVREAAERQKSVVPLKTAPRTPAGAEKSADDGK